VTEFTQVVPDEGVPASERTEIRILFDADALYVGARMYDSHPPTTRLGRRDANLPSDWLTVIFDSYHDHRTAFGFEVNPSGVRRDQTRDGERGGRLVGPGLGGRHTVDGGVDGRDAHPLQPAPLQPPAEEQVWGIQLERTLARRGEFSVFSFTPTTQPGGIQRFGHLHGLRELRTGRRLEALPYVVARGESVDRSGNPFRDDRSAGASIGVDVKYRLTSDLTLDATLNPDFGQVEVDPAQVNLSAIETFFQERRPFFVEGSEIFNFGAGAGTTCSTRAASAARRSCRSPPTRRGRADAARILARRSSPAAPRGDGRSASWTRLTERVEARFLIGGVERSTTAEPFTNYMPWAPAARLARGADGGGGMLTAVNRDLDTEAARGRLHSAAYTGGSTSATSGGSAPGR
jgi:hypothetical protein